MPSCGMAADIHQCKSIVPSLHVKLSAIQEAPMNMWLCCLILTFTGWFKNFQRPMPLAFRYSGSLVTVSLVIASITPAVQSYLRALVTKKNGVSQYLLQLLGWALSCGVYLGLNSIRTFVRFWRNPGFDDYLGAHVRVLCKPSLSLLVQPRKHLEQYCRELMRFFINKPVFDGLFDYL